MPRELQRIDRILALLGKLWKKHPDQRLGQLLENYVFVLGQRGDKTSVKLFYQEDTKTETILNVVTDIRIEKVLKKWG